jgi:hypothetical protein
LGGCQSFGRNFRRQICPAILVRVKIRERDDVANVLIEVKDLEDPDGWPSTDTVWIVTSMPREQLAELVPDKIKPDDWISFPPAVGDMEPIDVPDGMRALGVWYD